MAIPIPYKDNFADYITNYQAKDAVVLLRKRLKRKRKQLRECQAEKHALEVRLATLEERYGGHKHYSH